MRRLAITLAVVLASLASTQDPIVSTQTRVSLDALCKSGSETTGAASADGAEVLAGFVDFRTDGTIKNAFAVTSNGGQTWSHLLVRPPVAYQDNLEADPMTAYDPRTNTLFAGGISRAKCIYVAKKVPGQNAFGPSMVARVSSWPDKALMAAGPRPGQPDTTRLYVTYNEGVIWSDDLGTTWTPPISLGLGAGFLPRVAADGTLYVTYWDGYWGIMFTKSTDGGATWSPAQEVATRMVSWGVVNHGIPGTFRNVTNNAMAVDPVTGDIVIVYFDATNVVDGQENLDLYLVRSSDGGDTWTDAERLPFRPMGQVSDMVFPWIEFSKEGRLHLFAMDTSYNPGQTDGVQHGLWDQVYVYSDDAGVTWSQKFRLTPSSWDSFYENTGVPFLGDYQGMAASRHRVFPVYPDTRTLQAEVYTNTVYTPIVCPASLAMFRGETTAGTLASAFLKGGTQLVAKPGPTVTSVEPPIQFDMTSELLPTASPTSMSVTVTAQAQVEALVQKIALYRPGTGTWDEIDARVVGFSPTTATVPVASPALYVSGSTVRWRVTYKPAALALTTSWRASLDQCVLLVVP